MRFDYIVVGAGAAGGPLAARLSEDPRASVLLIEAGPDCAENSEFPAELLDAGQMTGAIPGHPNNWSFVANLTPELPYSVARGKILGGSTALNGTYFIRAREADFSRWAAAGNAEWSYEKVLPFLRKLESDLTYGSSELHGDSGPVPIFRETSPHPVTEAFMASCKGLGFPAEPDKNGEQQPGYGLLPVNAPDGQRINTGIAYINPVRHRANLSIRGDTTVLRVLFDGVMATGVIADHKGTSETFELTPGGEVVLCAGAIKSPHLLALSGIGPRADLERVGIPVVSDRPGVGRGFSDHADILLAWRPRKAAVHPSKNIFEAVLNATATGSPYTGDLEVLPSVRSIAQMMNVSSGSLGGAGQILRRPIATVKSLRGVSLRRFLAQARQLNSFFFSISVQCPESRGNMFLTSADPMVQPKIEYNYLSSDSDLERMRELVRLSVSILQSKPFRPYFQELTELDDRTVGDDARLDAWMRAHLATAIHASGSARMGASDDAGAVVDQFGRVHGVSGLRVADTSILPTVPSRGPAATGVLIGERIAALMRAPSGQATAEGPGAPTAPATG